MAEGAREDFLRGVLREIVRPEDPGADAADPGLMPLDDPVEGLPVAKAAESVDQLEIAWLRHVAIMP